jgi:hypothetical protein
MRTDFVRVMAVLAAAALLASCGSDKVTKPTGPVELRLSTQTFKDPGATSLDTVRAMVVIDGTDTVTAPDTIPDFPRGTHSFEAHLDIDYLISRFTVPIDPRSTVEVLPIRQAGTCRIYDYDSPFCKMGSAAKPDYRNRIYWSGTRIFCPAGDFGEFCTYFPDPAHLGASWPVDSAASSQNEYIAHGKLLIGAIAPNAQRVATAFYDAGDYSPRVRHHVDPTDSSVWQSEVWTDARHIPLYPEVEPALPRTDRPDNLLGLSVRTTYQTPSNNKNVMFVRFDVRNISDSADYRRVHPSVPVGGITITNVYLAPVLDVDVGGVRIVGGQTYNDANDDNGTMFPADSLVMAYDQAFAVPVFGGGYANKPGVVGMRLLEAPVGTTAKGLIVDKNTNLTYGFTLATKTLEDSTYRVIAGGREGDRSNCTSTTEALVCFEGGTGEVAHDVRIGWSLGPIASIAPGQSVSLTVAILFAPPSPGTFTSGTAIVPDNANITNNTRPIYLVAGLLRALGDQVKAVRVVGTPR